MTIQNLYRYMGTNGILDTSVHFPDLPHILRYRLIAGEGKMLINTTGYKTVAIDVNTEAEISEWTEIPAEGQK